MKTARTRLLASVALVAALALTARPATAQRTPTAADWRNFDAYVEQALKDWEVPGLALAVVHGDSVLYAKGYGVKELGKRDAVTPRTVFAIGSSSKAFTAALMAMLVDSGKVKWDDRVTDHLPWFQLHDPYATRELTIRDLLTHRSGLSRGDRLWYATELGRDSIIKQVRYLKPTWSLRSNFGYQNIMYLTAGQIEARLTGKSWDALLRERLLEPLGMTGSSSVFADLKKVTDVATPHAKIEGKVVPIAWRNIDNVAPAGSINSSVLEMAQWVKLHLANGEVGGKKLLSPAAMREIHSPHTIVQISEQNARLIPEMHFQTYGLGWFLQDYRGRKVSQHGGNIDGFSALVALMPEEKLGMVVLTNMGGTALRDLLPYRIYDMFIDGREKDWSAAFLELRKQALARADSARARTEAARVKNTKTSLALDRYAGTYSDTMYGEVRVRVEGKALVVDAGPAFIGDLEHWHFDTFRARWRDATLGRTFVSFQLDANGKVASVDVDGLATFRRQPDRPATATAAGS